MSDFVTQIVNAAGAWMSGIGTAFLNLVKTLLLDTQGNLTEFAVVGLTLTGIGVGAGIFKWVRELIGAHRT